MLYLLNLVWGKKESSDSNVSSPEYKRLQKALEEERRLKDEVLKRQKMAERVLTGKSGLISKILPVIFYCALFLPPACMVGLGYTPMTDIKNGAAINAWSLKAIIGALPMMLMMVTISVSVVRRRCGLGKTCGYLALMTSALVLVGPQRVVALGILSLLPLMLLTKADSKPGLLLGVLGASWALLVAGAISSYADLFPAVGNWGLWCRPFDAFGPLTLPEPEGSSLLLPGVRVLVIATCIKDFLSMTLLVLSMLVVAIGSVVCANLGIPEQTFTIVAHGSLRVFFGALVAIMASSEARGGWRMWMDHNLLSVLLQNNMKVAALVLILCVEITNGLGFFSLL